MEVEREEGLPIQQDRNTTTRHSTGEEAHPPGRQCSRRSQAKSVSWASVLLGNESCKGPGQIGTTGGLLGVLQGRDVWINATGLLVQIELNEACAWLSKREL